MPYHLVVRTHDRALLFRTHREARWLWDALATRLPGIRAMCLMPDHVHVIHTDDVRVAMGRAMQGYARRRNAHRGVGGALSEPVRGEALEDDQKVRRSIRYVHLNPCRAGIVADPLDWPWSTHRDAVGLTLDPVVRRARDVHEFHAYVSGDPTVNVAGTHLPVGNEPPTSDALGVVAQAVSEVCRVPMADLRARTPARRLFVRSARVHTAAPLDEIGAWCGITRQAAALVRAEATPEVRLVRRLFGDGRFGGLDDGDLTVSGVLQRYRGRR